MATTYTDTIALAKMATSDPFDVSLLNDNADTVDAAIKKAYQGKAAHNLLDNSDFTNPVNQRGETSYAGANPCIDMWKLQTSTSLAVGDGYCTLSGYYGIYQQNTFPIKAGKTYTVAARINVLTAPQNIVLSAVGKDVVNTTLTATGWQTLCCSAVANTGYAVGEQKAAMLHLNGSNQSIQVAWIALYEGAYTADTLPEYIPKGYAAEQMECQRYYQKWYRVFGTSVSSVLRETLHLVPPMRIAPTVSILDIYQGSSSVETSESVTVNTTKTYTVDLSYKGVGNVILALSAEL